MKIKQGMRIIENTGYGFDVQTITGCTEKTMATTSGYKKVVPNQHFRFVDEVKVARIRELELQIKLLKNEQIELFESLERVEL